MLPETQATKYCWQGFFIFLNSYANAFFHSSFLGLLNLDISWCYLRLGNLNELPNAQERLNECETNFKKSYGENLERVLTLKGNSCNEAVLYVRLHLLQAICAFISGKMI